MKTISFAELAEYAYNLKPSLDEYMTSLGVPPEAYRRTWIDLKVVRGIFPSVRYSQGSIGLVDGSGDRYAIAVESRKVDGVRCISRASLRRILEITDSIR